MHRFLEKAQQTDRLVVRNEANIRFIGLPATHRFKKRKSKLFAISNTKLSLLNAFHELVFFSLSFL